VESRTGAEREAGQARAIFQRAALAVGAKRRGLTRLLRSVKSSPKMGWTYPCTAVPGCPFLPMRHRVRCRFSCAGDRLRLMTPSEASPWFVTGRPPRTEVYERVPFQGWSVENSPGAKHRLVSTLQPAHLRRAGRCSSSPESASASAGKIDANRSSAAIFARWTPNVPRISPKAL
jgi:hypothetical protein